MRHGPHQGAQKSTKTGTSDFKTSASNVASVTTVASEPTRSCKFANYFVSFLSSHSFLRRRRSSSRRAELHSRRTPRDPAIA